MSWIFRSRKRSMRLPPRTLATACGPKRQNNSSPIFKVLTCGSTAVAHALAVSRSCASSATAIGAVPVIRLLNGVVVRREELPVMVGGVDRELTGGRTFAVGEAD